MQTNTLNNLNQLDNWTEQLIIAVMGVAVGAAELRYSAIVVSIVYVFL